MGKKMEVYLIFGAYFCGLLFLQLPFWRDVDLFIAHLFIEMRTTSATLFFTRITSLADTLAVVCFTGLFTVVFWWQKRTIWAYALLFVTVTSSVATWGLKKLVARPRPSISPLQFESTYSFPSGHAVAIFTLCGFLICYFWYCGVRDWLWVVLIGCLGGLIVLVGVSRVYLGVHWATDVLAGFCTGAVCLYLGVVIFYNKKV
ncbi:MAG: phosphatase PAP2 family protein [Culicoidibacterales bacterium]